MRKLFAILFALLAATSLFAQNDDPRISQTARLARINMDPVDVNYRTDYNTHVTGVLLEPSEGRLESKTRSHYNLAVPAGTLVDIPKDADFEPFLFTTPNGQTIDAMRVTLAPNTEATVYACGNGHGPKGAMIVKMIEPLVETRIETTVPRITDDGLRRAARMLETDDVDFEITRWHDPCTKTTTRKVVCTLVGGTAAYFAGKEIYEYYNTPATCNSCR